MILIAHICIKTFFIKKAVQAVTIILLKKKNVIFHSGLSDMFFSIFMFKNNEPYLSTSFVSFGFFFLRKIIDTNGNAMKMNICNISRPDKMVSLLVPNDKLGNILNF